MTTLAPNAPEGKLYMVIGGWHWQKDQNLEKAIKALMRNASFGSSKEIKAFIYLVPPGCTLTDYGAFYYDPKEGKPEDTGKTATLKRTRRSYKID